MKKIISAILAITTILGALLALVACKKKSDLPEGMQLVRGGEEYGYYFYAPEEWTVSNRGQIDCVYVSKLDPTSLTFVKAEKPDGDIVEYFNAEMAKLPFAVTKLTVGEKTTFGNATDAVKFTYSYEYEGTTIGVMQIFVYNENDFYIFTYTSAMKEKEDGVTNYEFYLEKLEAVISGFKFVTKKGEPSKPEYERTEDGYIIASDKRVAGFTMYLPEGYTVDYSSGIVSASRGDINISMSKATYTGIDKDTYWETRKKDLSALVDKTTDADGNETSTLTEVEGEISIPVTLEGVKWAYSYQYEYKMGGTHYCVYQVLIVKGMNGYVFTYTAKGGNAYSSNLDEAKDILGRIEY